MGTASILLLKLLPFIAGPGAVSPDTTPPAPVPIVGGDNVNTCGWPAVVYLSGNGFLCSGSLIHPQIVATAAHCIEVMEPNTVVRFGDTANSSQDLAAVDFCMGAPDFVSNGDGTIAFSEVQNDWGFCKLAEPITEVEPIPVAYGCEMDNIVEGANLVRVGFGKLSMANTQFFKRWVTTPINTIPFTDDVTGWPTQLSEGGGGVGTCPGDSGGPSFISVPTEGGGEAWRLVSIQSTQPVEDADGNEIECGVEANNTAVFAQGVPFIEEQSGVDVTPCFDVDGNWDPTFECQGLPMDPGAGGGTWAMGCESGPLTGFASTCGATFPELTPDDLAPTVAIVEPADELVLEYDGQPIQVHILVNADDADGWGVAYVELIIADAETGNELAVLDDPTEAYEWDPLFPKGAFLLQAIGYDNAGLVSETDTRTLYVGVDPPAGDDSGDSGSDAGDEGDAGLDDSGTGGVADDADDDDDDDDGGAGTAGSDDGTGAGEGGSAGVARGGSDDGCGCRTRGRGQPMTPMTPMTPMMLSLMVLGIAARRRHR